MENAENSDHGWMNGSGRNDDGTYTVSIRARFRVEDDMALRAANLVDVPGGEVPPDLGSENAILQEINALLLRADLPHLVLLHAQVSVGESTGLIQP